MWGCFTFLYKSRKKKKKRLKILVKVDHSKATKPKLISENCRLGFFVCSREIIESATSLTHTSTGIGGIQFSILKVLEPLIAKDQKKYNNTE